MWIFYGFVKVANYFFAMDCSKCLERQTEPIWALCFATFPSSSLIKIYKLLGYFSQKSGFSTGILFLSFDINMLLTTYLSNRRTKGINSTGQEIPQKMINAHSPRSSSTKWKSYSSHWSPVNNFSLFWKSFESIIFSTNFEKQILKLQKWPYSREF